MISLYNLWIKLRGTVFGAKRQRDALVVVSWIWWHCFVETPVHKRSCKVWKCTFPFERRRIFREYEPRIRLFSLFMLNERDLFTFQRGGPTPQPSSSPKCLVISLRCYLAKRVSASRSLGVLFRVFAFRHGSGQKMDESFSADNLVFFFCWFFFPPVISY